MPYAKGKRILSFHGPHLTIPIVRWSVCEPERALPDVGFLAPLLRRRLGSLAKMALHVAYACAHDCPEARIVVASQHGELAQTTTLLQSLSAREELSPTLFSMSVLNASAGLFSIWQKNTAPATAISAGPESFAYGLGEACLQLAESPGRPVLFVYADEPVSAIYEQAGSCLNRPHAVGMLLHDSAQLRVDCEIRAGIDAPGDEPQADAFLRCLRDGEAGWQGEERCWRWRRAH